MAGMSLQDLSNQLENKVSKQALSKYEQAQMYPTSDVMMNLSMVLDVKPDYFLKKKNLALGEISFRKRANLPLKIEEAIVEKTRDYVERFLEIEEILGISSQFHNPIQDIEINNLADVEKAANQLRNEWNLGQEPIPSVIGMLELKEIKVYVNDDDDKIDGFAVLSSNGIPVVYINGHAKPVERIRFTAIHELAHILLQFNSKLQADKKLIEKLCHYFASNFLLPKPKLIQLFGPNRTYIAIRELEDVKRYWGISIRALIYRLEQIGVIIPTYLRRWMISLTNKYGPKKEPGNYPYKEEPRLLFQLVNRALAEDVISISKASALTNLSIKELRKRNSSASGLSNIQSHQRIQTGRDV